jgi:two-component system, NtrC family, sensor histidine kinase HydH
VLGPAVLPVLRAFQSLRLSRKFTLAVVLVMAMVVLALTTLIIGYQRKALRTEIDAHELSVARNLARDAVGPLIFLDPLRLDELVRAVDQVPGCVSAAVLDRRRRVVAHTDRRRLGEALASAPAPGPSVEAREADGLRVKEIVAPVTVGDEVIGTVLVGFSEEGREGLVEEDLRALKRYILAVSSLILGLGVAGAFGLARVLTTPIQRLKETMALVQEGDLSAQVELRGKERCWDLLGCEERECPAWAGGTCWTIPATRCRGRIQGDAASKIGECKRCLVYRRACGDEIGELTAAFNEMVRRLGANVRRLEETSREKARLERVTALGEMSMTVAHEIKNPLNAIRGAASCLKDGARDGGEQEFLAVIEEETGRLDEIVTSFLRFSKPPPLKLQPADVNQVVKDTVRLVREEAREEGVELELALDERVPAILLDAAQFRQALLNVLVNALAATGEGGRVSVRTSVEAQRVKIAVVDTGVGMSEDVLKDIFKPFFTTKTRGSGLGLACVERVVREHGGEVAVRSRPGEGTEIAVSLPLEREHG